MRLGYSITSFHGRDRPTDEVVGDLLVRVRTAREAGYDYVQAGDHHLVRDGQYLQNVPTAARLTAEFDRVGAMFLLPLYDPLVVAEQAGTLAALADRFDFWCAVGGGRSTFEAFDVPLSERGARLEEALTLLDRLWTENDVTFDGEFHAVEDVSVNPKADARICVGGSAEPAVRRAGRRGDAWVAGPAESVDDLRRKREWFEDAGGGDLIVRRDALVLDDGDRAREMASETLANGYRGWPGDADWVVAGDADDATADLERLRDVGADEVVVRPMHDGHAAETLRAVARARERL